MLDDNETVVGASMVVGISGSYSSIVTVYFVLTGDFNINFCNSSHLLHSRLIINLCNSFQLTQVVSESTHVTPSSAKSLIDLIFLSHPSQLVHMMFPPPLGTSDHNLAKQPNKMFPGSIKGSPKQRVQGT